MVGSNYLLEWSSDSVALSGHTFTFSLELLETIAFITNADGNELWGGPDSMFEPLSNYLEVCFAKSIALKQFLSLDLVINTPSQKLASYNCALLINTKLLDFENEPIYCFLSLEGSLKWSLNLLISRRDLVTKKLSIIQTMQKTVNAVISNTLHLSVPQIPLPHLTSLPRPCVFPISPQSIAFNPSVPVYVHWSKLLSSEKGLKIVKAAYYESNLLESRLGSGTYPVKQPFQTQQQLGIRLRSGILWSVNRLPYDFTHVLPCYVPELDKSYLLLGIPLLDDDPSPSVIKSSSAMTTILLSCLIEYLPTTPTSSIMPHLEKIYDPVSTDEGAYLISSILPLSKSHEYARYLSRQTLPWIKGLQLSCPEYLPKVDHNGSLLLCRNSFPGAVPPSIRASVSPRNSSSEYVNGTVPTAAQIIDSTAVASQAPYSYHTSPSMLLESPVPSPQTPTHQNSPMRKSPSYPSTSPHAPTPVSPSHSASSASGSSSSHSVMLHTQEFSGFIVPGVPIPRPKPQLQQRSVSTLSNDSSSLSSNSASISVSASRDRVSSGTVIIGGKGSRTQTTHNPPVPGGRAAPRLGTHMASELGVSMSMNIDMGGSVDKPDNHSAVSFEQLVDAFQGGRGGLPLAGPGTGTGSVFSVSDLSIVSSLYDPATTGQDFGKASSAPASTHGVSDEFDDEFNRTMDGISVTSSVSSNRQRVELGVNGKEPFRNVQPLSSNGSFRLPGSEAHSRDLAAAAFLVSKAFLD